MTTVLDPRDRPVYTLAEAAAYAGIAVARARGWVLERGGSAIIEPAATRPTCLLDFGNLVELFVVADLRLGRRFPAQHVRRALRCVERELGVERVLVRAEFKTHGVSLFVKALETSSQRRDAVRDALDARLARLEWDAQRIAKRLFPLVRPEGSAQPRTIVIDPRMGFGRPVIVDTGIRTSIIAERFRAGESHCDLACDYDVEPSAIEDALRCQLRTAA